MPEPDFVFQGARTISGNSSTYTFTDVDIGTAAANRTLLVAVHLATNNALTFSGLTVNDVTATPVVRVGENIGPSGPTALFVVPAPTRSQATMVVSLSTGAVRCALGVVAAYGLTSTTPVDTGSMDRVAPGSVSVDVPPGGGVVGALTMAGTASSSATWTIMGETYDQVINEGTPTLISGVLATGLNGTVTVGIDTAGVGFNTRAVVAVFR